MKKTSRNKEADRIWRAYCESNTYSIHSAYQTRPSEYKEAAENDILQEMHNTEGYDYRIISHNGFQFTCGYRVRVPAGEILVYHTKAKRECIALDGEYRNGYTR